MSNIVLFDGAKFELRMYTWFMQRALTRIAKQNGLTLKKGQTVMDLIHDELRMHPNKAIRLAYHQIIETGKQMIEEHQKSIIIDLTSFGLWFIVSDTGYGEPFFYSVDQLIKNKDFTDGIAEYAKPFNEHYCKVWHDGKANTKKLQDEGILMPYEMSEDERVFVPKYQEDEWKRTQEEIDKQKLFHGKIQY